MRQLISWMGISVAFTLSAAAQKKASLEPQVHNTITLPAAAHKKGHVAGFFIDPITGFKVYRLSDDNLCPSGALHFYSYTNQFSPKGRMVFDCLQARGAPRIFPVYGPDFKLEYEDVLDAARAPGGDRYHEVQWSQEREVLYARAGGMVLEVDPVARRTRVLVNFVEQLRGFALPDGQKASIAGFDALSVGPGDRLMVHLMCQRLSPGCPADGGAFGIAVFDPASRKTHALYVPVPGDHAPEGFDEATWSQNPQGRLIVVYENAPNFSYSADLSSRVQFEDYHGHRGFFCGSNGRCYVVRMKSDRLPRGGIGQIGCSEPNGDLNLPWKPEAAIYDDETGRRVLVFGCDLPGQDPWQHLARSPGKIDVFGISSMRFVFKPSLERFFPTDEAILRAKVEYAEGLPARVRIDPVAYHRSAEGPRARQMGRECGYWAQPRMVMDFTGTRFMFDSTMSHPEWPALEGRKPKNDCNTDVFVAEWAAKP